MGFVAAVLVIGSRILPAILGRVALLGSRELFVVAVAVVAIGTAAAAEAVGVSVALGAFVAGLALAESDLAASVLGEVVPLRELFATIFFVSVGHHPAARRGAGRLARCADPAAGDRRSARATDRRHRARRRPSGSGPPFANRRPAGAGRRVQLRARHGRPAARRTRRGHLQPGDGRGGAVDPAGGSRRSRRQPDSGTGSAAASRSCAGRRDAGPRRRLAAPRDRGRLRRRGAHGGPRAGGPIHPLGGGRRRLPARAPGSRTAGGAADLRRRRHALRSWRRRRSSRPARW